MLGPKQPDGFLDSKFAAQNISMDKWLLLQEIWDYADMQQHLSFFDVCFEAILEIYTSFITKPDARVAYLNANLEEISNSEFGRLSDERFREFSHLILNHKKFLLKMPAGGFDK